MSSADDEAPEDPTEGLDEIDEDMVSALNEVHEGRFVEGPDDLEGEDGRFVEEVVPLGEFWKDTRDHKLVKFTIYVPDNSIELAADYMTKVHKKRAQLNLWDHFIKEPEWLLDEERHGLFRTEDGDLVEMGSEAYHKAFTEDQRRAHEDKQLTSVAKQRITQRIMSKSGVDGDFIKERTDMMPSDLVKSAARLSSPSQQNSASDHPASKGGAPGSEQNSSSTSDDAESGNASSEATTSPGEPPSPGSRTRMD